MARHGRLSRRLARLAALGGLAFATGCTPPGSVPGVPPLAPYVVVLGTAQDGGLPQIGARDAADEAARRDPRRRRLVASLLVCDPATGGRWLIDATPDLREQVERASDEPATRQLPGPRPPLFDGIFLTHAHMGHYTGLVHLGREAYAANRMPLHVSPSMAAFLERNAPWELLVRLGHVALVPFVAGQPIALAPGLTITPIPVPHRAEYTDTHAFLVRGPRRAVLYLPDVDKWERLAPSIESLVAQVDLALLDGTFFAAGEVPGRALAEVPHPFIVESLARFGALPERERRKIVFLHLNHTNPAADPRSAERRQVVAVGMRVAEEGEIDPL